MAIQIQGNSGTILEVEANTRALRVVHRPDDYGSLGIYNKAMTSGTMAAGLAVAANIYQFRWSNATNLCIIRKIRISAGNAGTGFTAGAGIFNLFPARSFTANGSGGTAGTLTGNNGKLRTSMGTMLVGDVRISSTAALTAGTWTLDTDPIAAVTTGVQATAGVQILPPTDLFYHADNEMPFVLAQNEGFTIQATVPATGTWTFSVQTEWEELASF